MAFGQKLIVNKVNLDKASDYMTPTEARFIKNLTSYVGANDAVSGRTEGQNALNLHSLQSNELYTNVSLPLGDNFVIHAQGFAQVNRVYVWVWNSEGKHCIYRLNGDTRTSEIVAIDPCFNFQFKPEYFIHEAGCWLEVVYVVDPVTNETIQKEDLYWTDGINPQGYLRVNDSIATDTFNPVLYTYFKGDYDRCTLFRMGIPTPMDCIEIEEVPNISDEVNNNIKFRGLQVRILGIDVWGRPTEHGIISDLYIWGGNTCSNGDNGARCLDFKIKVTNPIIDKLQIETSTDNSNTWHRVDVVDLYEGSSVVDWWLRSRNANLIFNQSTSTYTYRFCNDRENIIIPTIETNRTQNPISKTSQSLFKLNKNIALANNSYGYSPFSQELLKNITVELVEKNITDIPTRSIRIAISIRGVLFDKSQPIHIVNNNSVYGGVFKNPGYPNFPPFGTAKEFYFASGTLLSEVKQSFGTSTQMGLIGVLVGTGEPPITTVSEQYYLDENSELIKLETYDNFDFNREYFQVFTFTNIKAGKKIFQLCNPTAKLSDEDYWKTSCNVLGTYSLAGIPNINPYRLTTQKNKDKQFIIDVCDGDYDFLINKEAIVVLDVTHPVEYASFMSQVQGTDCVLRATGYVSEQENKVSPVELLKIQTTQINASNPINYSFEYTDQNGYYLILIFYDNILIGGNGVSTFYGFCQNEYKSLFVLSMQGRFPTEYMGIDKNLNNDGNCTNYSFASCNRVLVKGKISHCDTGVGISGVGIVLQKSQYAITNEDGEYSINAHFDATNPSQARISKIFFIQNNCGYTDCNQNFCLETLVTFPIPNTLLPCNENIAIPEIQNLGVLPIDINKVAHLLSGGTYGISLIAFDWLRRHNFSQTSDKLYFTVPTLAQSNGKYYSARVNINTNATFPQWVDLLTVANTLELSIEDYVEWVVDSFIFIDNSGNENLSSPTQIQIFYKSLNEYNKQNAFNTTTGWQFISEESNVPRTSDYVDFIINGDNTYFSQSVRQIVKYNKDGVYFLINYDDNLKNLKNNARIRLIRPKTNNNDRKIFYENCTPVKVSKGKPEIQSINLSFFDTYNVYRQIPIPVQEGETEINQIISYGTPFEHHSPNDLWGYKIKNIGRIFSTNPYEGEILKINEVALSGAMSTNGVLNYLNYFDDAKKTEFEVNNTKGIIAGFAFTGVVLFITQYYVFKVGFNDNLGRVNEDGTFQAPSIANEFGTPQLLSLDFTGCQIKDKGSIGIRNGIIAFVDRNRGELFQCTLNGIESFTKDKCDAYFRTKCRIVSSDPNRYFIKAINPITNEYIISDFSLTDKKYSNQLRTYDATSNETVSFDMVTRDLRMWASFIGENYAFLDGDILNNNLFSFKEGQPYNHYNQNTNTSFNNFFNIQGLRILEPVFNGFDGNGANLKKKKFLSLAIYCTQSKFFSDKIITDSNQLSYLLLEDFDWAEFFTFSDFKCDVNTPTDPAISQSQNDNKLLEGNNLYGQNISFRLIGDPSTDNDYCEITGVTIDGFISEKTG